MTNKDIEAHINKQGTKITKEKLLEAIKKCVDKEFLFSHDKSSNQTIIKLRIN